VVVAVFLWTVPADDVPDFDVVAVLLEGFLVEVVVSDDFEAGVLAGGAAVDVSLPLVWANAQGEPLGANAHKKPRRAIQTNEQRGNTTFNLLTEICAHD